MASKLFVRTQARSTLKVHKSSTPVNRRVNRLCPEIPIVVLLPLAVVNLLLLLWLPCFKDIECIFIEFIQILLVRNNGHYFASVASGDSAEGGGVFTFRTPGDIVDIRKL